jgi:outer membrane murein-binding lipoprotein Lpp
MFQAKSRFASLPLIAALVLSGLSLSACGVTGIYVDKQTDTVNHHINEVDAKIADASRRADAANRAAQSAQAAADRVNHRVDQLAPRVDSLQPMASGSF